MPNKLTKYECENCHTMHQDYDDAVECEASHYHFMEVHDMSCSYIGDKIPEKVQLKFMDKKGLEHIITYQQMGPLSNLFFERQKE